MSPYARAAYISHVPHDFGSILKYIEATFSLPSLGYADGPADDLADCFDLTHSPIKFQTIPAQLGAAHFLNDKRPPTTPMMSNARSSRSVAARLWAAIVERAQG